VTSGAIAAAASLSPLGLPGSPAAVSVRDRRHAAATSPVTAVFGTVRGACVRRFKTQTCPNGVQPGPLVIPVPGCQTLRSAV
jgi:hypothetical protein